MKDYNNYALAGFYDEDLSYSHHVMGSKRLLQELM